MVHSVLVPHFSISLMTPSRRHGVMLSHNVVRYTTIREQMSPNEQEANRSMYRLTRRRLPSSMYTASYRLASGVLMHVCPSAISWLLLKNTSDRHPTLLYRTDHQEEQRHIYTSSF